MACLLFLVWARDKALQAGGWRGLISDIRLLQVRGRIQRKHLVSEERQVGALDLFPEYRRRMAKYPSDDPLDGKVPIGAIYARIETDEGLCSMFGPIMRDQAFQIDTRLRPHLIGQDPLAVKHLGDVMVRHDRHSRKGYMMIAISAVDIALWDIRGKYACPPHPDWDCTSMKRAL